MNRIYLIRAGATDFDEQGRIQGNLDMPLSERGIQDVSRTARELQDKGLEVIYHGPCLSARQTASAIGTALDVKTKKLDSLENLDHGLWQGLCVSEVKRKQPRLYKQWQEHPETLCPPAGEMISDADKRIEPALAKLLKRHKNEVIGLVVPEPLAALVRSHLLHTAVGDLWKAVEEHGRWEVIELVPAGAAER